MKTIISFFLLFIGVYQMASATGEKKTIANWYEVRELKPNLFLVSEPSDGSFYILKSGKEALFVDSGFGLEDSLSKELLKSLGIDQFKVAVTHAHCDHVGMNSLAKGIYISKNEWDKYLEQNEIDQIKHFYEFLKDEVKWPNLTVRPPVQKPWKPTHFINEGSIVKFGKWELQAHSIPGHTSGHLFYYEPNLNVIFSGDIIYDGTLYAHLKDSNLKAYYTSILKLDDFIKLLKDPPLLLPSHNTIPLSLDYISTVKKVISKILDKKLKPMREEKGNSLFETANRFEDSKVKISVKK